MVMLIIIYVLVVVLVQCGGDGDGVCGGAFQYRWSGVGGVSVVLPQGCVASGGGGGGGVDGRETRVRKRMCEGGGG